VQMRKQIIITRLFEFGGSNSHLKTLIKYFGRENIILVIEHKAQLNYLQTIDDSNLIEVKVMPGLHPYAHLAHASKLSTIKEFLIMLRSVGIILLLCLKNNFAAVTVNVVEPEKHLYLFWLPLIMVNYIVHTTPQNKFTYFTSHTCNTRLGKRKKIITVSNSNKELLCTNWDIAKKKWPCVKVIHNCIVENGAVPPDKVALSSDIQSIVTLGHVVAYKNPHLWLEVAKSITALYNDVHFIWLGNGPLFEALKKETLDEARITFAGVVNNPEVYLAAAAIYYQPSLHETHGIAVLEAMYHHLPCVVSDTGGLPESIHDKYNGLLVSPLNKSEHVNALVKLIDDPGLRTEYGQNGFIKYRGFFSYEKFKSAMDKVYLD
jgi:glycosyltransferase involved in cell wall biosynthesis